MEKYLTQEGLGKLKKELVYLKGGFGKLVKALVNAIVKAGGNVSLGHKVIDIDTDGSIIKALCTDQEKIAGASNG